ncbi:MAG TPA: hypothetical protein VMY06_14835 [Sedimentisphaerales bacterium]|nr:hypothetical protein [Sedimentisphaerales bacterium]HUU15584.1 hypothetical protein [Sedimentisphaerales bacterium]
MGKVPLSNAIDSEVYDLLERLTNKLGPPKNRIIESAIEVFGKLDINVQQTLKSNRHEERKLILDLIGALTAPSLQEKYDKGRKNSKSG